MEEENKVSITMIILMLMLVWAVFIKKDKYEGQTAEEWFNAYDEVSAENEDLNEANEQLREALEEANNNIEDAKNYAWDDYYEMGYALDDLKTVSEP